MSKKVFQEAEVRVLDLEQHRERLSLFKREDQLAMDLDFSSPPNLDEDLFFSPVFAFTTCLPVSEPRIEDHPKGAWIRKNGTTTLELRPQSVEDRFELPSGKHSRMFLIWLFNTIKTNPKSIGPCVDGSHALLLRTSYRKFCESVGVDPSKGARGAGRSLIDQIVRLIRCEFVITREERVRKGNMVRVTQRRRIFRISSNYALQWDEGIGGPKHWLDSVEGAFLLSPDLVDEVRHHAMPVDKRITDKIFRGKSAFRIDLFHWLHYRNWALHRDGRNDRAVLLWKQLYDQFGYGGDIPTFVTKAVRPELAWIKQNVWPSLCAEAGRKHFILKKSPPASHIPPKLWVESA